MLVKSEDKASDGFSKAVARAYAACVAALAAAHRLDDVKDIRDGVLALAEHARQRQDRDAELRCLEICLRAERRWGELYRLSPKAVGTRGQLVGRGAIGARPSGRGPLTLSELGVSYSQSVRWQRLATLPDDEFEAKLLRVEIA
jgi:hypothetical protein